LVAKDIYMKKSNNAFLRYFLFYLSVAYFYGLYSYILDQLLFKITPSSDYYFYRRSPIDYIIHFIVTYGIFTIPISMGYNAFINNYFTRPNYKTILCGLAVGLIIGTSIGRKGISYYIGEYRSVKQIIVFGLMGLSIEIMRRIVVNIRMEKNKRKLVAKER
jgi:hypothetical protein